MDKLKVTKEKIVKSVAEIEQKDIALVRSIYNTIEDTVVEALASATPDKSVSVKLFEGVTIDSIHVPEKVKKNNLSGKLITVAAHIKPKASVTRNFCEKLNLKL